MSCVPHQGKVSVLLLPKIRQYHHYRHYLLRTRLCENPAYVWQSKASRRTKTRLKHQGVIAGDCFSPFLELFGRDQTGTGISIPIMLCLPPSCIFLAHYLKDGAFLEAQTSLFTRNGTVFTGIIVEQCSQKHLDKPATGRTKETSREKQLGYRGRIWRALMKVGLKQTIKLVIN